APPGFHLDAKHHFSALQKAKLLKPLQHFKLSLRPGGIGLQRLWSISINTDVMKDRNFFIIPKSLADIWNDFFGKIEGSTIGAEHSSRASDATIAPIFSEVVVSL